MEVIKPLTYLNFLFKTVLVMLIVLTKHELCPQYLNESTKQ